MSMSDALSPREKKGRTVLYIGIALSVVLAIAAIVATTVITDEGVLNQMDLRYVSGFAIFGVILPLSMEIRERVIERLDKKIWTLRLVAIIFLALAGTLAILLLPSTWTDLACCFVGFAMTAWCARPSLKENPEEKKKA